MPVQQESESALRSAHGRVYHKDGFVAKADAEFTCSKSLKAAPAQTSPASPQP
jgi:hypothetical protein